MKKALLIGASLVVSLGTAAQTLNVVVGEVTYKIPAFQAGSMDYADGSKLTILGKTFQLKEVTRMYVDHSDVADNSVSVTYNGSAAAVTVAGNCMSHLDVTVNGSAVSIVQDETVDTEISYSLSGASDNGSFYMDGHYKATVVFDNLSSPAPTVRRSTSRMASASPSSSSERVRSRTARRAREKAH